MSADFDSESGSGSGSDFEASDSGSGSVKDDVPSVTVPALGLVRLVEDLVQMTDGPVEHVEG